MVLFPCHIIPLAVVVTGVLLLAEQLGGAVQPFEPGPEPVPPAVLNDVGPSVEEWAQYLRKISDELEDQSSSTRITRTQEDKLFSQVNSFLTQEHICMSAWFVCQFLCHHQMFKSLTSDLSVLLIRLLAAINCRRLCVCA